MANFKEFFAQKATQCALMAVTVFVVFMLLLTSSHRYFRSTQEAYVKPWQMADSLRYQDFAGYMGVLNSPSSKTLLVQYQQIEHLKCHHLLAATTFYRNYYSFATTLTLFSVLLAVSIFLLIKKGWDTENTDVLKALFVSTSILTTVLYGYIQVYDLQNNIAKNLQRYFAFEKIQIDLHSACANYNPSKSVPNASKKDPKGKVAVQPGYQMNIDSLVVATNHALKENRGLMVDFSVDRIPRVLEQSEKFGN